jgi:hypothetical protein
MASSATSLVDAHGFDLARNTAVELQVLVCECARCEVAQALDSLRYPLFLTPRCFLGKEGGGVFFSVVLSD